MNFDFYQQYQTYSNIELLKITRRPADYQPSAVAVASQLLSEREVLPEELQLIDQYFQDLEDAAIAQKQKVEALKNKTADFLEPVLHPSEAVQPKKWVDILLLAIAVQYVWSLYGTARQVVAFLRCNECRVDITFIATLLTLLYVPFIFFLLYKRKRWGWILLFADNLFTLLSSISQSYIFFKYQDIHHGSTTSFLLPIFIKLAFVFFLWREPVATYFNITNDTKKKTATVTALGTVLFVLSMYFIYG